MIVLRDVSHRFDDRTVLSDIDLTLAERRIAVIGANGSGKSTFARLLNGLQLPSNGRVEIDGLDTRADGKAVRRKVGFVFQNPDNQIVLPTVEEDLAFGLKNLSLPKQEIRQRIDDVLSRYDLDKFRSHLTHRLSGGQKQLLAIAGVLAMEPSHIVLDEPTTLLDLRNKRRIMEAIEALSQQVVLVTHDLELVQDFERVLVIDEGRVACDDKPAVAVDFYKGLMG